MDRLCLDLNVLLAPVISAAGARRCGRPVRAARTRGLVRWVMRGASPSGPCQLVASESMRSDLEGRRRVRLAAPHLLLHATRYPDLLRDRALGHHPVLQRVLAVPVRLAFDLRPRQGRSAEIMDHAGPLRCAAAADRLAGVQADALERREADHIACTRLSADALGLKVSTGHAAVDGRDLVALGGECHLDGVECVEELDRDGDLPAVLEQRQRLRHGGAGA